MKWKLFLDDVFMSVWKDEAEANNECERLSKQFDEQFYVDPQRLRVAR